MPVDGAKVLLVGGPLLDWGLLCDVCMACDDEKLLYCTCVDV